MRDLRLVGLTGDGARVVFVDDSGSEFAAPADDKLRAALRGQRTRQGQLEIEMDSALRPRDIQARIRAGDSPEAVAVLAQVSVEKILPYCVPVLAERQHVAGQAQRSHVRRTNTEGPARRLRDVVTERLRGRGVDPESVEWDAWRRDDGRWSVQVTYRSGERERCATFSYDQVGRYSLAVDDEAKWLTGERQATSKGPQPREGVRGERRLSAVPNGEDLLSLSGTDDEEVTDDLTAVVRAVREEEATRATTDDATKVDVVDAPAANPDEVAPDDDTGRSDPPAGSSSEPAVDDEGAAPPAEPAAHPEAEVEDAPRRKRRTGKRASVPSWDEIMFGRGDDD